MSLQHEPQHGYEHEQQREQREEREVSHQRREVSALVVAELLEHRQRDRQPPMALLESVEPAQSRLEIHVRVIPRTSSVQAAASAAGSAFGTLRLRSRRITVAPPL